jgi:nitroreductase
MEGNTPGARGHADTHSWSSMCANAPVVIAVVGDPQSSVPWAEDCSAAVENLLLAVTGLNLGAVWVGIYPRPERKTRVREILNIPEGLRVLCLVPVGNPAEVKTPRTRYEESKVHYEVMQGEPRAQ